MSEGLVVEVDGEIDDRNVVDVDRGDRPWRLPVAVGVVGVLLLAVLVTHFGPAVMGTTGEQTDQGAPAVDRQVRPSAAAVPTASTGPWIKAATAALAAWGRFATTGDVGTIADYFDTSGPQYRLLMAEARELPAPTAGAHYEVTMEQPSAMSTTADEALVSADVKWRRPGAPDQAYRWTLVLRRDEGDAWRLWTVLERP